MSSCDWITYLRHWRPTLHQRRRRRRAEHQPWSVIERLDPRTLLSASAVSNEPVVVLPDRHELTAEFTVPLYAEVTETVVLGGGSDDPLAPSLGTTIEAINFEQDGNLSPGSSPGIFGVDGNTQLAVNSSFTVEIGGTTAGNHNQLSVTGDNRTITLNGAELDIQLINSFVPTVGGQDVFRIVDSTGTGSNVVGVFKDTGSVDITDGSQITVGSTNFTINYNPSGSPGDVVLTESGNGAVSIVITGVPPFGTGDFLRGVVTGVDPATHRVAPYIQVEGLGWYNKPTFLSPTVPIQADGTFIADVVTATNGLDDHATILCVALIPAGVTPPEANGAGRIPAALDAIALDIDCVERHARTIVFSDLTWGVKAARLPVGPGVNRFSSLPDDVFVDQDGKLHLTLTHRDGNWWATEVYLREALAHGTYSFQTESDMHNLDPNITFGAFTWDPFGDDVSGAAPHREIDIEQSRWGNTLDPTNSQFVVQPYHTTGNLERYTVPAGNLTQEFTWMPNRVDFRAVQGHHPPNDHPAGDIIHSFSYDHDVSVNHFIPTAGNAWFRFNLWLNNANAGPSDGQNAEVVIPSFSFKHPITITETGGNSVVSESGQTDTFTVALDIAPEADVVLTLTSDDTAEVTISRSTLTFTPSNWDQPQQVTVSGVDDSAVDGDQVVTVTVSVDDDDNL